MNDKKQPAEAQKTKKDNNNQVVKKTRTEPSLVQHSKDNNYISITNAEKMINSAIEKGLPVESLKELMAMRDQIKKEWAREQYYFYLSKFQGIVPEIKKNKKVHDKQGKHRFSYTPLDEIIKQVKDSLKECGFSYNLKTKQDEKSVTVVCYARHLTGHTEETEITMPIDPDAFMSISQKVASAITFAKRYAFCNAFGIMTADEDVETAKEKMNDDKKGVLIRAGKIVDHMTDDEKQYFTDLKNNTQEYTELKKQLDIEAIKSIEQRIKENKEV